jgi:alpha/beta superfamily hydrolase
MAEEKIFFSSNSVEIEGLLWPVSGKKAMVVTHPHPLYGGSMHNGVVETVVRVYQQAGYATLRFNFRGVGNSRGTYDNGVAEQEDIKAAIGYLTEKGNESIILAGYSFGSWVNALAVSKLATVQRMVMISPPVAFMDFQSVGCIPQLQLVVVGSLDDIAPVKLIKTMLPIWNSQAHLEIIEGADHFYGGYQERLKAILVETLTAEGD